MPLRGVNSVLGAVEELAPEGAMVDGVDLVASRGVNLVGGEFGNGSWHRSDISIWVNHGRRCRSGVLRRR